MPIQSLRDVFHSAEEIPQNFRCETCKAELLAWVGWSPKDDFALGFCEKCSQFYLASKDAYENKSEVLCLKHKWFSGASAGALWLWQNQTPDVGVEPFLELLKAIELEMPNVENNILRFILWDLLWLNPNAGEDLLEPYFHFLFRNQGSLEIQGRKIWLGNRENLFRHLRAQFSREGILAAIHSCDEMIDRLKIRDDSEILIKEILK